MAAHVPEVDEFREPWLSIHRRNVSPVPGVRFYSGGSDASYIPEREACAQTIMNQAHRTLDFRSVVEAAYADGVRVFIEHGPMGACSGWIREVLGERAAGAVVVALDRKGRGIDTIFDALGALIAAGVSVDPSRLLERLGAVSSRGGLAASSEAGEARRSPRLKLPAHRAPVRLPPLPSPLPVPSRKPVPRSSLEERPHHLTTSPAAPQTSRPAMNDDKLQIMQPAPMLPPAAQEGSISSPMAVAPPALGTAPPREPAPAAAAPDVIVSAPGASADPAIAAWHHQVQQLSAVHRQFVAQQAQIHQRFIAARQGMQRAAEAIGQAAGSAVPLQSPSVQVAPVASAPMVAPALPLAPPPAEPAPAAPVGDLPQPAFAAESTTVPVSVVRASASAPPVEAHHPKGIRLDRGQLEVHASGRISEIYGPLFEQQDDYARQVRMPEPPLLLADRVTGIDAEPGVHGRGVMWTETDVREDSWYLHRGRMPAGIMIESGQADLMLISYMGADFLNKGERVYRLLGCELTYEGDLPKPGETLSYEIHVDGHAQQDDVRLFFFHYDCLVDGAPRIRVRGGQAGFFSDEELANSDGILWSAEAFEPAADARLDAPAVVCTRSSFSHEQLRAFAAGRAWECFGEGFDHSRTHTESPTIQAGKMLFLDEVSEFDPKGGPWGRGYLRGSSTGTSRTIPACPAH